MLTPILIALVGVLLSVGVAAGTSWRTLARRVDTARHERAAQEPNELKKKGWDFWTVEIENLSGDLKEQMLIMKKRSEELDQRQQRIVADEKQLAKVRSELEAMQKEISDRVIQIKADEEVNLKKLASMYANLTPKAVVAIIREMDDTTAVKILSLMKPDVVGPIFEQMTTMSAGADNPLARRAAILTEKLRLMKASAKPATGS
jgi:flagellar motility protein MotE (MotC chaperone)